MEKLFQAVKVTRTKLSHPIYRLLDTAPVAQWIERPSDEG